MAFLSIFIDNFVGIPFARTLDLCDLVPRGSALAAPFVRAWASESLKKTAAHPVDHECGQRVFPYLGSCLGKFYDCL